MAISRTGKKCGVLVAGMRPNGKRSWGRRKRAIPVEGRTAGGWSE
jgi:hypothetical protein